MNLSAFYTFGKKTRKWRKKTVTFLLLGLERGWMCQVKANPRPYNKSFYVVLWFPHILEDIHQIQDFWAFWPKISKIENVLTFLILGLGICSNYQMKDDVLPYNKSYYELLWFLGTFKDIHKRKEFGPFFWRPSWI